MTLVEFFPFKNSLRLKRRKKVNIFNVQVIRKKKLTEQRFIWQDLYSVLTATILNGN